MRVLVAPKAIQEGPRAARVAEAIASGVEQALSDVQVDTLPLADGGDGTFEVIATLLDAEVEVLATSDLYGRDTTAHFGRTSQGIAVIEMTHAAGVGDVNPDHEDPLIASTFGVGQLIKHALDRGARQIVLGAGGSGTIDAGIGALGALGVTFHDAEGRKLDPTPKGVKRLASIDTGHIDSRLANVPLLVLSDTTVPLIDNVRVYGADKGVDSEAAPLLNAVIRAVGLLAADRGCDILTKAWVGAGGGLAGGLSAFAGATVIPGASFVMRLAEFEKSLATADHVFTAGGVLNRETFRGKLPYVVAQVAGEHGIPTTLLTTGSDASGLPALPAKSRYATLSSSTGDGIAVLRSFALAAAQSLSADTSA